ncbi:MAG TPA: lysine--tRNA ligase [Xanthomonadales bacterium]|nr:lysine--tRNA ligase [Xanthomonadales bacterium]
MEDNNQKASSQESHSENPAADEGRLIAERRAKLSELRKTGQAFPNDFRVNVTAGGLQHRFRDDDKESLESVDEEFAVAGRMMAKRVMGKIAFVRLQDHDESVQLMVQRDNLPEGVFAAFKHWDVGDIVGGRGRITRTNKGELSVRLTELRLLSKSLRPMPEKWHGLTDTEQRYRQRYVDLIVNDDSRKVFLARSRIISFLRDFMEAPGRDFVEVETPMMHPIPGGAAARPFVTHHNALDINLYLRVAPELYLKRLIVGGLGRVYEINRSFRNEGVSTRHNPEFTMLEFYWAFADFNDMMDMTEAMLRELAVKLTDKTVIEYQGLQLDFGQPIARLPVEDAVRKYNPDLEKADLWNEEALRSICAEKEVHVDASWGAGRMLMALFDATVEEHLQDPVFITMFPTEVSPLSRRNDDDPRVTDRFELYVAGREIANGFSELNDPEDQADRFREQVEAKDAGDSEAMHFDDDYIRALEYGMPPTGGEGIGIDRLVMLFTNQASIRDVLLFPYMRPEKQG